MLSRPTKGHQAEGDVESRSWPPADLPGSTRWVITRGLWERARGRLGDSRSPSVSTTQTTSESGPERSSVTHLSDLCHPDKTQGHLNLRCHQ